MFPKQHQKTIRFECCLGHQQPPAHSINPHPNAVTQPACGAAVGWGGSGKPVTEGLKLVICISKTVCPIAVILRGCTPIEVNWETPSGVVAFEGSNGGARDAETYAQLWAAIVETVALEDNLEWRPTPHDECWGSAFRRGRSGGHSGDGSVFGDTWFHQRRDRRCARCWKSHGEPVYQRLSEG